MTGLNVQPSMATLRTALSLLSGYLEKKKGNTEHQIKPNIDYKNILMLAYYRNNLTHVFINEAYIACSLTAFGMTVGEEQGISLQRLWEQTEFLAKIFKHEFVVRDSITTLE